MVEQADVVVVGARCGGASAAMLLAQQGRRVVLLERGNLESDVVSTLYIQPPGMAHLRRWGLLDEVIATGAPELAETRVTICGVTVTGRANWPASTPSSRAPRRHRLDPLLAGAAARHGADVRLRATMATVTAGPDGAEVTYRHRAPDGRMVTETIRAHLVIGADGMRSKVAEQLGAETVRSDPTWTCAYYAYWSGLKDISFCTYEEDAGWVSAVPTSDDLVLVSAYFPQARFEEVRLRAEEAYQECIRAAAPDLWQQLASGERVGAMVGFGDQRNFIRRAQGPGWALIGDAGMHKDSLTARGIGDAFLQSAVLAHHMEGHEPGEWRSALERFERDRDALLTNSYLVTQYAADPANRPARAAALTAISGDPASVQGYFDAVAGLAPMSSLGLEGIADASGAIR